jgi:hypothetical protein
LLAGVVDCDDGEDRDVQMLRWALWTIVFQAVHRQRDELLLCAGISNTQGEWTAVLGLTEGSLAEIHHLSKATYNAKSALGLSPPFFKWVPESAEEVSGDREVSARRSLVRESDVFTL